MTGKAICRRSQLTAPASSHKWSCGPATLTTQGRGSVLLSHLSFPVSDSHLLSPTDEFHPHSQAEKWTQHIVSILAADCRVLKGKVNVKVLFFMSPVLTQCNDTQWTPYIWASERKNNVSSDTYVIVHRVGKNRFKACPTNKEHSDWWPSDDIEKLISVTNAVFNRPRKDCQISVACEMSEGPQRSDIFPVLPRCQKVHYVNLLALRPSLLK